MSTRIAGGRRVRYAWLMGKTRWLVLVSAVVASASSSRALAAYAHKSAQADEAPASGVLPSPQTSGAHAPSNQAGSHASGQAPRGSTNGTNTGAAVTGSQSGLPDEASLPPLPPSAPSGAKSERTPLRVLDIRDPWNVGAPLATKAVRMKREVDLVDPWDRAASPRNAPSRPTRARLGLDVEDPWSKAR
jgi:hypothetical protein